MIVTDLQDQAVDSNERKSIMIVEDETIVALDIKNMVISLGYQVVAMAHDSDQAIQQAGIKKPDLILMDMKLGENFEGVEAAQYIRDEFDIPVIFVTGYTDETILKRAMVSVPFGYVTKPFEKRQLHSSIEMALFKHDMEQKLRKSEQQLKESLKEKETLLREMHHRVKNNLQVISSLLNLQADHIDDPMAYEMLRESRNRVYSISLIHEALYKSPDFEKVDFCDYIRNLTANLFSSFGARAGKIHLIYKLQEAFLKIETAIPCGLIINELVSNALKYAFNKDQEGSITVEFRPDGENFIIAVSDNGKGLPDSIDIQNSGSTGMELVTSLTQQLGGTIVVDRTLGTSFTMNFPFNKRTGKKA
jgi:two-component sensor histidine kinase